MAIHKARRHRAERLMKDRVVITRKESVTLPDYTTEEQDIPVYAGKCRVQTYEPDAIVYTSAGRPVVTQEYRLHVPVEKGPFQIGDIATVVGYSKPFRIDGLLEKTDLTAQRLKVTIQPNSK